MYSNSGGGKKEIQHFSINPREINGRLMKGMSAIFANGIEMEENYQFILAPAAASFSFIKQGATVGMCGCVMKSGGVIREATAFKWMLFQTARFSFDIIQRRGNFFPSYFFQLKRTLVETLRFDIVLS